MKKEPPPDANLSVNVRAAYASIPIHDAAQNLLEAPRDPLPKNSP